MSISIKVTKLDKVRYWFEDNAKKLLVVGFLSFVTFVALSLVALTQGIGYEATANITSIRLLVKGHPCFGYLATGSLNCTFNTFLYPVTHIFGYETNEHFIITTDDAIGKSVKEGAEISAALREFFKNVPYFLAISLVVAFGSSKLVERFRRLTPK